MSAGKPSRDVIGRRVAASDVRRGEFTYTVVIAESARAASGPIKGQPGGEEQRGDRRVRTRLHDGVIAGQPGRAITDCRISDRSRTGARLQLDKDCALPSSFLLTDVACRAQFRATLIWQAGCEAGVRLKPV